LTRTADDISPRLRGDPRIYYFRCHISQTNVCSRVKHKQNNSIKYKTVDVQIANLPSVYGVDADAGPNYVLSVGFSSMVIAAPDPFQI